MATEIRAPEEQEGTKAVLKTWLKKVGDTVRINDPIVELETDKVAVEIAAEADGVLSEIVVEEGAEVEPGTVLGRIADSAAPSVEKAMKSGAGIAAKAAPAPSARPSEQLPPGIRRMLEEHGLSASDVPMSGARLTREDITAEVERRMKAPSAGVTRVPHDTMRKRIAEHLSRSVQVAPHVTAFFEADFSAIAAHRAANKNAFAEQGVNLTYTPYFVAASVAAMTAAPAVNGRWFDDRIDIYDDVNIGIGTALGEKGLIVPVIHRAQTLSLLEIAKQLTDLTERARNNKLEQEDVRGGTFSISNHGVSGSLIAAPIIINQPQSAILGVGKLEKRAVARGDEIVIRPMAYVSLTIDHRVIDAFQTNAWLTKFVETLENWPANL
ncbi:MAG TPA: 2-oxo acid dehydrogenase subunit E2 [Rhizomicrobium sp.]|jgi:2-oxoglutarate dehydrogenase E2 component (dihydrolipoamide succinyltransferase)